MFLSFCALVGRVPVGTGIVLAAAACSPAVMFAVERANMDIALFSVLAVSVLVWRAFPGAARVVSPALVLLAAMAKLYPAFALPAFVVARSRVAARIACSALRLRAIRALRLRDVSARRGDRDAGTGLLVRRPHPARASVPPGGRRPVGGSATPEAAARRDTDRTRRRVRRDSDPPARPFAGRRRSPPLRWSPSTPGALIYLGTFAVANNFDYRLVFLLLTLPQLVAWVCTPAHPLSAPGAATLFMILVLLWVGSLSRWLHLWDELASWAVAGLLVALVVATVPAGAVIRTSALGRSAPDDPAEQGAS